MSPVRMSWFNVTAVTAGLAFLYIPIVLLIVYSFNDSRLVTVWGGFSLRWYRELLHDAQFQESAWVSLQVGVLSATVATVLGVLIAIVLVRFRRFRGRAAFTGLVFIPMAMPELMLALALLLFFVSMSVTPGFWTLTLAHVTLSMGYAAVAVEARLRGVSSDLEEAAQDLGCTPVSAFLLVTVPLILPAVLSAWTLSFTISLDNVVTASFVSGPSATTVPLRIYSSVRQGVSPEINAACTILVAVVTSGILLSAWMARRREARLVQSELPL